MTPKTMDTTIPYPTRNDLTEDIRSETVDLLNRRLAEAVDLATQAKVAHWNVKGPSFIALHELFDQIHAGVQGYADLIAERAVQLGGIAAGTARVVARTTELDEYPLEIATEEAHVNALASALAAFGALTRAAIDTAGEMGDQATADIFTEITRGTDKWLWFVEAHRQGPA